MQDEHFEWDDEKAAKNLAAHGVSFETAKLVFGDAFGVELLDDRRDYGEERWVRIGVVEGTILTVVYTERSERKRLISARQATKLEQDDYFRQNAER
jgi:uncharacterized DUF497 family protein